MTNETHWPYILCIIAIPHYSPCTQGECGGGQDIPVRGKAIPLAHRVKAGPVREKVTLAFQHHNIGIHWSRAKCRLLDVRWVIFLGIDHCNDADLAWANYEEMEIYSTEHTSLYELHVSNNLKLLYSSFHIIIVKILIIHFSTKIWSLMLFIPTIYHAFHLCKHSGWQSIHL